MRSGGIIEKTKVKRKAGEKKSPLMRLPATRHFVIGPNEGGEMRTPSPPVLARERREEPERGVIRRTRLAYPSSFSFNFASTLKSSSDVVSPFTSPPAATSFRSRRMILPLRVLGRDSVKRI